MDRRSFLKGAGAVGGALLTGGLTSACDPKQGMRMLDRPASVSPIDHVVVVMMENRSFDHWLGWLADDEAWLEAGRSRYGSGFGVAGDQSQTYPYGDVQVPTAHLLDYLAGGNPWRGCGHPDPGHGWNAGRAQRDGGFLAPGSGNDPFALGYYLGDDLPVTSRLARTFTVCDQSFASILGPTYPNREYLHSAQSGGYKTNYLPVDEGGFGWETIWPRLAAAGVSAGYYYTDLPVTALWGSRLLPWTAKIDDYFTRCADGTLPQVSFVDPGFLTGSRTDNHPHGDVRAGEAFVRDVFGAFARSPHWQHGLFVLTYDEWGGFFDHVAPPILADDRASTVDADNFGQAGFRVPTILASPYVRPGSVDHRRYDHTSVLRFLEWRYLGAPPEGPGSSGDTWFLTSRDRHAQNLGASLYMRPSTELAMDLDVPVDPPSADCDAATATATATSSVTPTPMDATSPGTGAAAGSPALAYEKHSLELAWETGYFERVGYDTEPSPMAREWTTA